MHIQHILLLYLSNLISGLSDTCQRSISSRTSQACRQRKNAELVIYHGVPVGKSNTASPTISTPVNVSVNPQFKLRFYNISPIHVVTASIRPSLLRLPFKVVGIAGVTADSGRADTLIRLLYM